MTEGIVPAQLRIDIGYFYGEAIKDHPYTKINNTRLLASALKNAMKYAEVYEHDLIIEEAKMISKRAWHELKGLNNEGLAVQSAQEAIEILMFFMYDKRFANPESSSFTGRGQS